MKGVDPRKLMPDVMHVTDEVEELYKMVKERFLAHLGAAVSSSTSENGYACYQVRLGDFESVCNIVDDPNKAPTEYYRKTAKEYACAVQPAELLGALVEQGYPAFIMSDNSSKLMDVLQQVPSSSLPWVTSDWIAEIIQELLQHEVTKDELDLLSLIVDQKICSESQIAVLNKFSTVSQRVVSLRRGEDENVRYWKK